jgi:3'-phosphoadenosine 5'-phosphosulfate sulfotransferase (PAPS reductase)/FAD synthetase
VIAFSGGRDSTAAVLAVLDVGVPRERIELWHHEVDGREGGTLMDWPVTRDYCRRFAAAFALPIHFSWKVGGFEREMLRTDALTAPTRFETPAGDVVEVGGVSGTKSTRRRFPQMSADLNTRWCSAYLKIQVMDAALINQARFRHTRTLVVTGERAEESANRARYAVFEPHRADRRDSVRVGRHIDHWRPTHQWNASDVWALIERHRMRCHPAYEAGFGRLSCAACIFGSSNQWRTLADRVPSQFARIAEHEAAFGVTIHRKLTVLERAGQGTPYAAATADAIARTQRETFDDPIIVAPGDWRVPAGAVSGDAAGPT